MKTFVSKVEVNSDIDTIWNLLVDKIRSPNKYVPGVESVKVLEDYSELSILREMVHNDGKEKKTIKELIFADEKTRTVIFKLVDNPNFEGFVSNIIYQNDEKLELEYLLHWSAKGENDIPDMTDAIHGAIMHTKKLAEERA